MFRNYLKTAWRSLIKHKLYSAVNLTGLAVGIASCMLIGLFIWSELRYDRFHQKGDALVRVTMNMFVNGEKSKAAVTGTKIGPEMARRFPQVKAFARTMKSSMTIAVGNQQFEEKKVLYADSAFFTMFSFPVLQGDALQALNKPNQIVLTPAAARKFFGDANPIGKVVKVNGKRDYTVSAIAAPPPMHSQIQYDMVASFTSLGASKKEEWWTANYITYVEMHKADQLASLQKQFNDYMSGLPRENLRLSGNEYLRFDLQPVRQVHLHSELAGLEPNGSLVYVYVLLGIALLILIIAGVNYTNLATAQAAGRGVEVGVRKVMGAGRKQLLRQFLGESFLLSLIAALLAFLLAWMLMPLFNQLSGKEFHFTTLFHPLPLAITLVVCILISLLAGAYPAIVLSGANMVRILKSGIRISGSGGQLRKSLIVIQFVISVFLISITLVVIKQINFIRTTDLGMDRAQVLVLPHDGVNSYEQLSQALALVPGVQSVSGAYDLPTSIGWGDGVHSETEQGRKEISVNAIPVGLNFSKTMGMELLTGTDFSPADFSLQDTGNNYSNYRSTYLINETAAKALGWTPEEAVGKTIVRNVPGQVKGVVKDFHFATLHEKIAPLVVFLDTSMIRNVFVKLDPGRISNAIAGIGMVWKERVAHRPFDYHFLDEDFEKLYQTEQKTGKLFTTFSGLAIFLACLGLFALAAFTTAQRNREIGIRKVLGASVTGITMLVAREFIQLVLLAILIATPLSWWVGNQWLGEFAYRIPMEAWILALGAFIALAIALLTVGLQAVKAALANPVRSLRG